MDQESLDFIVGGFHLGVHFCHAGDLLMLLNVSSDQKILPTTFGELRPPLGKHRLKVDFIPLSLFWWEMNM